MTTQVLRTACPLDCPDACSLDVTVTDGTITKVDAAPAGAGSNPLTDGWICQKVKRHHRRVYAPERILTPLIRTGAKGDAEFRAATWDEALDVITARITAALDEHGPDAIVPYLYSSSAAVMNGGSLAPMLFERMGAPEVEHTICAASASAAKAQLFGGMLSADPLDLPHARLVVIWGANPTASNTHLLPLVTEAKRNGATIVVIDPRATGVAQRADVHLAVMPGTDVVLAYAVTRLLIASGRIDREFCDRHTVGADEFLAAADEWTVERAAAICGLTVAQIERFAELVSTREPALLRMGWGLERNRNGGSCWLAPPSLWLVAGHFGQRGSGIVYSTGGASGVNVERLWDGSAPRPERRTMDMNLVASHLLGDEPWPVAPRVLFIQGANPAVTAIQQERMLGALALDEVFTVVHEQVMTDTARYADVVLPATTHFESDDFVTSYGSYSIQRMPAVIDRVGESRSNNEVAAALAARLGYLDAAFTMSPDELVAAVRSDDPSAAIRLTREAGGTVQFVDTFPTFDDGRARLFSPDSPVPLPTFAPLESRFPLALISPASGRLVTSMFGEFNAPEAVLSIHPDDAETRGVADGAVVEVVNDEGRLTLSARLDPTMRRGVCCIPKGIWLRDFSQRRSVNVLVPNGSADLGRNACFNDARVEVSPVR